MGQAESRHEKFWEACGFGETRLVEHYIQEGVDVNWISATHNSRPIHAAALNKPDIITLLVKAGCDVNALDERGCTALHHASMKGYENCVKLLLEYEADIDIQNKNGWTALHSAAYWGHADTLQLLLDHDADITIKNNDNRLAIHEACRSKSEDKEAIGRSVSSLIYVGSEIDTIATGEGGVTTKFTCLMFACYHGNLEAVKELIAAGCNINLTGTSNWTALHWASDRENIDIVRYLLENGADSNLKAYRSETAYDRAKSSELKELLSSHMDDFQEATQGSQNSGIENPTDYNRRNESCSDNETTACSGDSTVDSDGPNSTADPIIPGTDLEVMNKDSNHIARQEETKDATAEQSCEHSQGNFSSTALPDGT